MQVRDIMISDPVIVDRSLAIEDARIFNEKCGFRHLPVVDGRRLVGIVSDRDLLEAKPVPGELTTVGELMSPEVVCLSPDEDVLEAAQLLLQNKISCLPVVEADGVVGIVTDQDILGAYVRRCDEDPHDAALNPPISARMTRNLILVQPITPLAEAWAMCEAADVRHLIVTAEQHELLGIVSDRDLRLGISEGLEHIADVSHPDVLTRPSSASLASGARAMLEAGISSLPITEGGELVGILTSTDLLDHCLTTRDAFRAWRPTS